MSDIVLRDIDPMLEGRIRQLADARGWTLPQALQWLLEQGLHAYEQGKAVRLDPGESDVLQEAIAALEGVPDDPGFSLIGRELPAPASREEPDQSIGGGFSLE